MPRLSMPVGGGVNGSTCRGAKMSGSCSCAMRTPDTTLPSSVNNVDIHSLLHLFAAIVAALELPCSPMFTTRSPALASLNLLALHRSQKADFAKSLARAFRNACIPALHDDLLENRRSLASCLRPQLQVWLLLPCVPLIRLIRKK